MPHPQVFNLEVKVDPWKHQAENQQPIPLGGQLACAYEIDVFIDQVDEIVFFNRTDTHDELWTAIPLRYDNRLTEKQLLQDSYNQGRVAQQERAGTKEKAAERLLKRLLRSRVGFEWPSGFVRPGLITRAVFESVVHELESGFKRNAQITKNNEAPIVSKARSLNLQPVPSHTEVNIWRAQCPGHHVGLQLNNKTNQFYCGYCKRGGDEQELVLFVEGAKS